MTNTKYIIATDGTLQAVTTTRVTCTLEELTSDRDRLMRRFSYTQTEYEEELAKLDKGIADCVALGVK